MDGLTINVRSRLREFKLDLRLTVPQAQTVGLVGPSGAGKTTLLRIVAGLARPKQGAVRLDSAIWLDTKATIDLPPDERRCGYLFQDYALFPQMKAWRNVAYGIRGRSRSERRRRARDLLRRFGVEKLADARPTDLSGGERQRVALARALATEPQVLLLDEPLSALDPATRQHASRELASHIGQLGVPILLVTHSFEEAALLSDWVIVLDQGSIVQQGLPPELSARPRSALVAEFAGAVVLDGIAAKDDAGLTVIALDSGGQIRSTDQARGPVSVCVYPWEISLERPGAAAADSLLNRLTGTISSVTEVGNRVRVGISTPQPLTAEITSRSSRELQLRPGVAVTARWKATTTRIIADDLDADRQEPMQRQPATAG